MPESTTDSSEIVREQSESVAATNLKTLGDGPAFYQNMAYGEAIANTQAMNQLRMTLLGKIAESVIHTNAGEGASNAAQTALLAKMMQSTPPLTAGQDVPNQGS